jgi:hypothetical protein
MVFITQTAVGFVKVSNAADRFWDWALWP